MSDPKKLRFCTRCHSVARPERPAWSRWLVYSAIPVALLGGWALNMASAPTDRPGDLAALATVIVMPVIGLTRAGVCPKCGSRELVPTDSPRAREIIAGGSPPPSA